MSEEAMTMSDDSSHYEISLTAGQAFLAFVLLLFSLAASFAFGLMVGKGQTDDRLVVKREPTVINEGRDATAKPNEANLVELGVPKRDAVDDAAKPSSAPTETVIEESPAPETTDSVAASSVDQHAAAPDAAPASVVSETKTPPPAAATPLVEHRTPAPVAEKKPVVAPAAPKIPVYAQLLSSSDAKSAETLAAKLIDSGFTTAYVERLQGSSGMTYRVRVKFSSEDEARGATDKLRSIAKSEPWITKQ